MTLNAPDELGATADLLRAELAWREAERTLSFGEPDPRLARGHLLEFIRHNHPGYLVGWFHRQLCRQMEWFSREIAAERSPRLMIAAPPRHGKSEVVSRQWPLWHLGRHPDHEVVVASYGQALANDMSRDARSIRTDAVELFEELQTPKGGKDGVEMWQVCGRGSYKAVGAGGALTGRGAHALVIDDPFKNSEQANSETIRESRWEWYLSTSYTRLAPGGGILVMNTRWHEDDLSGRLLDAAKADGDQWRVVCFPAIAEEDEEYRKIGEALHPERYSAEYLDQVRRVVGSRIWAALYQQRPSPAEGALFRREWMRNRYTFDPQRPVQDDGRNPRRWTEVVVTMDATFKAGTTNDFVSIQAWAREGWARFYLLDEVHVRMGFVDTLARLKDFVAKWHPNAVLVEEAANGTGIIDTLKAEGKIPGIVPFNPSRHGKKEERAEVASVRFEAGDVWLPDPQVAPWVGDYVEELCAFPQGANDDRVDAVSQLFIWWLSCRGGGSASETNQGFKRLLAGLRR